ncbi:MAG: dihydrolipoyl dehydrogenase [Holophagales bacterium]|nr:dihydrolipoyl dehydrogenase [Holophagales bacterium]MYG31709.1 dihydrolipoyl dehydrogenase [Holophagales bacterium]MYI79551.1 dihydrolipoyl dehydrogenase [Holophagales bacterium]
MTEPIRIVVPDIGDFESVDVVEVLVSPGEHVDVEAGLITLESDKASMEVPSTHSGVVLEVAVSLGDKVAEGDLIAVLDPGDESHPDQRAERPRHPHAPPETPGATSGADAAPEPPAEEQAARAEAATPSPSSASKEVDAEVLVLGAGPGGYTAAFRAADLGRQVVLVEPHANLGGVCLNVGCIPSKALLHAARVVEEAAEFAAHGIDFGAPAIDRGKLGRWKDVVVGRLTGGLAQLAERRNVEVVRGCGRFTGSHEVEIEDADGGRRTLTFGQAIVAVGSRPAMIPGLPEGDPRIWDSTDALELDPEFEPGGRLLVIGGGIIGLEMATVYAALGYRVTVVELLPELLTGVDRDLVRPLRRRLGERLENVHVATKVTAVKAQKNGLMVSMEGENAPGSGLFGRVLVAVGRRPNSDRFGAEAAGIHVDEQGFVPVDDQQRTNVPHIFAIGDLVPGPMLAHKATHEGKVAAEVAAGEKSGFEARVIPSVAYTDPEVAWVGLTETEARRDGIAYKKGVFPWSASGRALTLGRAEGTSKLLFDPGTGRVIGAGIVGVNAGDLIAEAALAIEMNADAADLALTVHPHPTLSETVAFAAEAYEGTITDLYLPRRGKR